MGKCFPRHDRVEYMSGAVAENGGDFALIADTRIQVGARTGRWLQLQGVPVRRGPGGRPDLDPRQLPGLRRRRPQGLPQGGRQLSGLRNARRLPIQPGRTLPQDPELAIVRQARGDLLPGQGPGRELPWGRDPDHRQGRRLLRRGDATGGRGGLRPAALLTDRATLAVGFPNDRAHPTRPIGPARRGPSGAPLRLRRAGHLPQRAERILRAADQGARTARPGDGDRLRRQRERGGDGRVPGPLGQRPRARAPIQGGPPARHPALDPGGDRALSGLGHGEGHRPPLCPHPGAGLRGAGLRRHRGQPGAAPGPPRDRPQTAGAGHPGLGRAEGHPRDHGLPAVARGRHRPCGADLQDLRR